MTAANPPDSPTQRAPIWVGASAAGLASLVFGQPGAGSAIDLTQARHLALLPLESLELDLSDPGQRRLGDYELIERIGEGGMGVVYRARQGSLDREVAVKLLAAGPWASRDFIERFKREAQNAARMQHPNIVAIYEVGEAVELHFFSMRLVRGHSLAAALRERGRFDPSTAARLLRTVAEAIAYAHSLGVLHLDLKPGNVLLDEAEIPHVADFGLARRLDSALSFENDEISGTPAYMAPEQAEVRAHRISAATDIWGLGAILYEMVCGEPPFRAGTAQETLRLVREGRVRPPRRHVAQLPRDLEAIILKCLARSPADRYASARALADDLGRFVERRAVLARPLNAFQRLGRWGQREPRLAAALGASVLALAGGLVATTLQWRRAERNSQRAEAARAFLVGVFEQADPDRNQGMPLTPQDLLRKGETALDAEVAMNEATRADITGMIGSLFWDVGDYDRADRLLKQAVMLGGEASVPAAVRERNLLALARTANDRNRYAEAIHTATEALALAVENGSEGRRDASAARRLIANALIGSGNARDAESLLRTATGEDRSAFGENSVEVADDELELGYALLELSRLDDSATISRVAIDAETRIHGRANSDVLFGMGNLAIALRLQGKYPEAEKVLREVVATQRTMYPPNHRESLSGQSNLLLTIEAQGRFQEALRGREELLGTLKGLASRRPDALPYAYKNIAGDLLGLGRFADADKAARTALRLWANIEGKDDEWHTIAARDYLAKALQFEGKYEEAEQIWRRAINIQRRHEPATSIWLAGTRGNLGNLLRLAHRNREALAEQEEALSALPDDASPQRAQLLAQCAESLLDIGDVAAAAADASASLAMARSTLPPSNFKLAGPLLAKGRTELAHGDAGAAESTLREALAVSAPPFKAGDPRVLEIEVVLVETLDALHRPDEAAALRARIAPAVDALRTPFGTDLRKRLRNSPDLQ